MDSRASPNRKEFMKERTKRTSSGESRKRAPNDAPAWAIKSLVTTRAFEELLLLQGELVDVVELEHGEVVQIMEAEGWRQIQHQQGGKLHFLPRK